MEEIKSDSEKGEEGNESLFLEFRKYIYLYLDMNEFFNRVNGFYWNLRGKFTIVRNLLFVM